MVRLNYRFLVLVSVLLFCCAACNSPFFSGAQLVYDRRAIQQGVSNHQVQIKANHALFDHNPHFKRQANISIIAFNRDLLVVGQVPNKKDKVLADQILKSVKGTRKVYNELTVGENVSFLQSMKDAWITSKLRARMIAENDINPGSFKVITENGVVYLLGDVKKEQADIVVELAKQVSGVSRIVRIFHYFRYVESEKLHT